MPVSFPRAPRGGAPDAIEFRATCGQFATGVTVLAVREGDSARGMTANSFTSLSVDPPLVAISVDKRNRTHDLLGGGDRFAINVLAHDQAELSARFAMGSHREARSRFDGIAHTATEDGLPLLDGCLAHLVCRVVAVHPVGDHSLFVGLVEQLERSSGQPLLFHAGRYHRITAPSARPHQTRGVDDAHRVA